MKIYISIVLFLVVSATQVSGQDEYSEGLINLSSWMTGSFDSSEQAAIDTSYYDISLHMARIWPDKPNGIWLYVEQAVASMPAKPYRQRVYFVSELEEDSYTSDVYTLRDEQAAVGAWKDPAVFGSLTPFDLVFKEGCTVFLTFDGFQFAGNTDAQSCKSEMQGASYATSEAMITNKEIRSWDRGYNDADEQVWGATEGPYIFKRR